MVILEALESPQYVTPCIIGEEGEEGRRREGRMERGKERSGKREGRTSQYS